MKRRWLLTPLALLLTAALGATGFVQARAWTAGEATQGPWIVSKLDGPRLQERVVVTDEATAQREAQRLGVASVGEVVREAPLALGLPGWPSLAVAVGRDGVHARYRSNEVYLTPLELTAAHACEQAQGNQVPLGLDWEKVWALLGERFATPVPLLREEAVLTRVTIREHEVGRVQPAGDSLTPARVEEATHAAASYLVRRLREDGRYDYQLDAATGELRQGYNLPRHAGTTLFVAQAARHFDDTTLRAAARRAIGWLLREKTQRCGTFVCVGDDDTPNIGSAALALLAYTEYLEGGHDAEVEAAALGLASFLRHLQRPDGEFQHRYDRRANQAIDVQYPYFSGEATLALARVSRLTHNADDLQAAKTGLSYAVHHAWSFFGSRYFMSEEHWTCQALAELWDRAPDDDALGFCLRWHDMQRSLQFPDDEPRGDSAGAFGMTAFAAPRLTPAGSRAESAGATLSALLRARKDAPEAQWLRPQLERALRLSLRNQFDAQPRPGVRHPDMVAGGFPTSTVDWDIRIDTVQHIGSALLRWLELQQAERRGNEQ